MKLTINGAEKDVPDDLTVRDLVVFLGLGEGPARDRVVREFALAARSSGGVEQRLDGVFARLLAQE